MSGLPQKRVLVYGIGLHGGGESVIRYLRKKHCEVRVVDQKPKKLFKRILRRFPGVKGVFGTWKKSDVDWADVIVKNPGVPPTSELLRYAKKKGKNIFSDIVLFYSEIKKQPECAVTGTRGKSTTTALIAHALALRGSVVSLGNNRQPVLSQVEKAKKSPVVLELSSFQIEDSHSAHCSPHIGVFTNLYPDHLNRYTSLHQYFEAKKLLFAFQTRKDFFVANFDDTKLKAFSNKVVSQKLFFSFKPLPSYLDGCFWKNESLFFRNKKVTLKVLDYKNCYLSGEHNKANIAAAACALFAFRLPLRLIKRGLATFRGLPGRIEYRGTFNGIRWINDTTSTNAESLVNALQTVARQYPHAHLHVIIGGSDKGFFYKKLSSLRSVSRFTFYVLEGSASKKMVRSLRASTVYFPLHSLSEAIQKIRTQARRDDVALLSPGAASFGMFQHEFDRGDQFNHLIKAK